MSDAERLDTLLIDKLIKIPLQAWLCMGTTCSVPLGNYRVVLDRTGWLGVSSSNDVDYYITIFPREEPDFTKVHEIRLSQKEPLEDNTNYKRVVLLYKKILGNKELRARQLKEGLDLWLTD